MGQILAQKNAVLLSLDQLLEVINCLAKIVSTALECKNEHYIRVKDQTTQYGRSPCLIRLIILA